MQHDRLDGYLWELGVVGQRMVHVGAAEGAAGNLSIFVRSGLQPDQRFGARGAIRLPVRVPMLANGWVIVTASGQRLRDIAHTPATTTCLLAIGADGEHAELYAADGVRPTSELNTHLAVHNEYVGQHHTPTHAVAHAQPLRLTYLSHLPRYNDPRSFSRRLLRWQPEMIMEFPEGLGTLAFYPPGSDEQMAATVEALQQYRVVMWQKHGIVARATEIGKAADLIEYAEAAAAYEYLDLCAGEQAPGLTDDEIRQICTRLGIQQTIF